MPEEYDRPEGVTDAEWREYLAGEARLTEALLKRECPDCKGPLTKTLDSRQAGVSRIKGTWFSYRCAACKFMLDQYEPN